MDAFDPAIIGMPKIQPAKSAADQKFDELFGGSVDEAIVVEEEKASP